jgi:outer membrane protein assembly factor BamB
VFLTDRVAAAGFKKSNNESGRGKGTGTERVLCLNEADGKLLWKHEYECVYNISYSVGPRATPLVNDGKVYTLGAVGNLTCLNTNDGKPIWSHDFVKEYSGKPPPLWGYAAHPLLDGRKLICIVGGPSSTVVSFDKDTGKEIWRALSADNIGYCPPMIYEIGGTRQLIIWHGESANGLDPETGKVYWTVPFSSYQSMSIATPRRLDGFLFLTSTLGKSAMLRLEGDKPGAAIAWRGDMKKIGFDSVFATPFVEDGYVYGSTSNGELVCIKAATGDRLWTTLEPNGGKKLQCAGVFIVKNGDRFFLANEMGDLIIARLSAKGYHEIGRAHLLDATSSAARRDVLWSHPAFADRSIFMRNDKEIICVSLAATE